MDGPRETCPVCLATLVDDADAVIECPQCGRVCPARMQSCPDCLALLRPDDGAAEDWLAAALGSGRHLHRPAGQAPFASGPSCTVLRLVANGGLVLCGAEGLIEADVLGIDHRAVPPLRCTTGSTVLFRLERYDPVPRALVAVGADGAALGTYLHVGSLLDRAIDVRDETSAPVGRFEPVTSGVGFRLVETGGRVLASASTRDVEVDGWIDDAWSVTTTTDDLPLAPLAVVALALAAKVLLGRLEPVRVAERPRPTFGEDLLGPD